jgi:hypothetical protein
MRSADAIRFSRVIAEDRGITVGAREVRLLNKVGVRPDNENGVVERGVSYPSVAGLDVGIRLPFSPFDGPKGLGERLSPNFSSASPARSPLSKFKFSWLVILRFPPLFGWRPTTVP